MTYVGHLSALINIRFSPRSGQRRLRRPPGGKGRDCLELLPTGDLARRTVAIARTARHVFRRLLYGDRDLSAIAAREVDDLDRGPWPWTVIEDRRRLLDAWGEATAPDLAITRALALGDTVERLILIYLHAEPGERVLRLRTEYRNLELLLDEGTER